MKRLIVVVVIIAGIALVVGCEKRPAQQEKVEKTGAPKTTPLGVSKEEVLMRLDKSLAAGVEFLIKQQSEDGYFGKFASCGITGLCLTALARSPEKIRAKYRKQIGKAADFIVKKQVTNGSFVAEGETKATYSTSLAIMALIATDRKRFEDAINKGKKYLLRAQYWDEMVKTDLNNGGWGYKITEKGEKEPNMNLSTTAYALEALRRAGVPKDHPVWKRALVSINRSHQNSETNDVKIAGIKIGNDGGFIYGPGKTRSYAPPIEAEDGSKIYPSYASMTYAGLKSFIYAGVDRNDPRVKAAVSWIKKHYTLEENYGMGSRDKPEYGLMGLYYYYHTLAKALGVYGEKELTDSKGNKHKWANEFVMKLESLQHKEGYWVNEQDKWYEGMKEVVTAYVLESLNIARKSVM